MKELMFRMNNTKKIAIKYGLKKLGKNKIEEYETESTDDTDLPF